MHNFFSVLCFSWGRVCASIREFGSFGSSYQSMRIRINVWYVCDKVLNVPRNENDERLRATPSVLSDRVMGDI